MASSLPPPAAASASSSLPTSEGRFPLEFRCVLWGDPNVGKSTLLARLIQKTIRPRVSLTFGASYGTHEMRVGDDIVKMGIWDLAGKQRNWAMGSMYFEGALGVLLLLSRYERSDPLSKTGAIRHFFDTILPSLPKPHPVILLCGNKSDLPSSRAKKDVTRSTIEAFAKSHGLPLPVYWISCRKDPEELIEGPLRRLVTGIMKREELVLGSSVALRKRELGGCLGGIVAVAGGGGLKTSSLVLTLLLAGRERFVRKTNSVTATATATHFCIPMVTSSSTSGVHQDLGSSTGYDREEAGGSRKSSTSDEVVMMQIRSVGFGEKGGLGIGLGFRRLARVASSFVVVVGDVSEWGAARAFVGRVKAERKELGRIFVVSCCGDEVDDVEEEEEEEEEEEGEVVVPVAAGSSSRRVRLTRQAGVTMVMVSLSEDTDKQRGVLLSVLFGLCEQVHANSGSSLPVDYMKLLYPVEETVLRVANAVDVLEREMASLRSFEKLNAAFTDVRQKFDRANKLLHAPDAGHIREQLGRYLEVDRHGSMPMVRAHVILRNISCFQGGRILGVPRDIPAKQLSPPIPRPPVNVVVLGDSQEGKEEVKVFVEDKKRRGRLTLAYRGFFRDGAASGLGEEYDERGKGVLFRGEYAHGMRHGRGMEFDASGARLFRGLYVRGRRSGRGEEYSDGHQISRKGTWRAGQLYRLDTKAIMLPEIEMKAIQKYLVQSARIGGGGNGEVFKVIWKKKEYAAKLIFSPGSGMIQAQLLRVLRVCASLVHPNLIKVHAWFRDERLGSIGYLMDLCVCNVADLILKKSTLFPLDIPRKLDIMYRTSLACRYLHENSVMHRDLKPGNVLVDQMGDVKLSDMDFSKVDETAWRSSARNMSVVGTPLFLSPEISNQDDHSKACDVYSFGVFCYCLLFETMTPFRDIQKCSRCSRPFGPLTFTRHVVQCDLRPPLPPTSSAAFRGSDQTQWLVDLMRLCWTRVPEDRPTFDDVVELFRCHIAATPATPTPIGSTGSSSSNSKNPLWGIRRSSFAIWEAGEVPGSTTSLLPICLHSEGLHENDIVILLRESTLKCLQASLSSKFGIHSLRGIRVKYVVSGSSGSTSQEQDEEPQPLRVDDQLREGCVLILPIVEVKRSRAASQCFLKRSDSEEDAEKEEEEEDDDRGGVPAAAAAAAASSAARPKSTKIKTLVSPLRRQAAERHRASLAFRRMQKENEALRSHNVALVRKVRELEAELIRLGSRKGGKRHDSPDADMAEWVVVAGEKGRKGQ